MAGRQCPITFSRFNRSAAKKHFVFPYRNSPDNVEGIFVENFSAGSTNIAFVIVALGNLPFDWGAALCAEKNGFLLIPISEYEGEAGKQSLPEEALAV